MINQPARVGVLVMMALGLLPGDMPGIGRARGDGIEALVDAVSKPSSRRRSPARLVQTIEPKRLAATQAAQGAEHPTLAALSAAVRPGRFRPRRSDSAARLAALPGSEEPNRPRIELSDGNDAAVGEANQASQRPEPGDVAPISGWMGVEPTRMEVVETANPLRPDEQNIAATPRRPARANPLRAGNRQQ